MRLDEQECWDRLEQARHGVLATVSAQHGVDAVPVVFAVVTGEVVIPVDTVKDKRTSRLQRVVNVERDPRCVLLADHYEDDWSRLWWVWLHARATVVDESELASLRLALARRYPAYEDPGSVVAALRLHPRRITGWKPWSAGQRDDGP